MWWQNGVKGVDVPLNSLDWAGPNETDVVQNHFNLHRYKGRLDNSRILHYIAPSYGRPKQGHLTHCILGKCRQLNRKWESPGSVYICVLWNHLLKKLFLLLGIYLYRWILWLTVSCISQLVSIRQKKKISLFAHRPYF